MKLTTDKSAPFLLLRMAFVTNALLQTLDGIPLQRLEIIEGSVELREKKLVQALADCVKTPFFVLTPPRSDVDSIALESIKKARALGSMVTMVK